MKKLPLIMLAICSVAANPAFAQHGAGGGGHGGGARGGEHFSVPARGPMPFRGGAKVRSPVPQVVRPHVENGARWVGHDTGPADARYQLESPWSKGRFTGEIGRGHIYRPTGWDQDHHRFWFDGNIFILAPSDWDYANDWVWTSDEIVLYDDPDHAGFYLAYNTRLGTYVHVQYEGAMQVRSKPSGGRQERRAQSPG